MSGAGVRKGRPGRNGQEKRQKYYAKFQKGLHVGRLQEYQDAIIKSDWYVKQCQRKLCAQLVALELASRLLLPVRPDWEVRGLTRPCARLDALIDSAHP